MDVSLRGAVSIARRLQDPLAELVKIDPKSIGVGQYQHDLAEIKLSRSLDAVVEDCVNAVGVDVNTASVAAAAPGCPGSARALAEQHRGAPRRQRPVPHPRTALKDVPRLGPKAFEQCAGFLRIRGGDDPLDVVQRAPRGLPGGPADPARRPGGDVAALIGNAATAAVAAGRSEFADEHVRPAHRHRHPRGAGEARPRPAAGVQDGDLRRGRGEDGGPARRAWCWRAWSPTWPRSARSSTSACTRTAWCTCPRCRDTSSRTRARSSSPATSSGSRCSRSTSRASGSR